MLHDSPQILIISHEEGPVKPAQIDRGQITTILPDLWMFEDSCNVYPVKQDDRAIAIDFGSGDWLDSLPELGVKDLWASQAETAVRALCPSGSLEEDYYRWGR